MSCDARDWAWSLPDLPPSTRLLLLALAEHVRDGVTCFPGQTRLAAMCGVTERQLRNLLHELRDRGLVTVEHRPGQGGGRKSNLYRLEMSNRKPDSDCPEGYLEAAFRNSVSGCAEATGNLARATGTPFPPNRKRETEEGNQETAPHGGKFRSW
jgi:predicted ArsR family transcriptional regulator